MTNKPMLSVERELIEWIFGCTIPQFFLERHEKLKELRALLDKPSEPSKFVGAAQYWSENEQVLRDVCRFEGLKGLVYQVVRDRDNPAAQHQGEAFTYSSKQATNCAGCGLRKHTPLRVDDMGGYVCLTCIDNRLGELLGAERRQVEPVAIVDESDDGLFIEFVYGEDGNPLKRGDKLYAAPPAKRRGEPVAYADPKAFENFGNLAHLGGLYAHEWMWAEQKPGMVALYTEQPAPVARGSDEKRS